MPDETLSQYERLEKLGEGGMGVVYRARDKRLDRLVALKFLPDALARDARALDRFRREARATSALNHPNICTLYDIGDSDGHPFLAMELLEGETLQRRVRRKPLRIGELLDFGIQIADALDAAHSRGIIHRDIKPSNVFITKREQVKLLDFGLAKETVKRGVGEQSTVSQEESVSGAGSTAGTLAYMSPEQARGEELDARTDLFSLGSLLYEMGTGVLPFAGATSAIVFDAILNRDPRPASALRPELPLGFERLLEKMLEKDRDLRSQSASEIRADLRRLKRDLVSERRDAPTVALATAPQKGERRVAVASSIGIALAALAFVIGFLWWFYPGPAGPPSFHRVTFRRGYVPAARFSPDGATIIYGAAWDGRPNQVFSTRIESPESRPLGLSNANILAVSRKGDLALSLSPGIFGPITSGTLAEAPLGGGTPREVLEGVEWADWTTDAADLAVVRSGGGKYRIEYPPGKIQYETGSSISQLRFSPDGRWIAFAEHPLGDFSGSVAIIDRAGKKKELSRDWGSVFGLAWKDNNEIWFTAYDHGDNPGLRAVTVSGRQRLVARTAGWMTLHDVFKDGRALLTRDGFFSGIMCAAAGNSQERDLYWLDYSIARDLSDDGSLLLFHEGGEAGGRDWSVYIRKTDGSPAIRLGDGFAMALSTDKKWAMVSPYGSPAQLIAVPTAAGHTRELTHDSINHLGGRWLTSKDTIIFVGNQPGHALRYFVQGAISDTPRAITPEGVRFSRGDPIVVSPDARSRVAVVTADGRLTVFPIEGEQPEVLADLDGDYAPLQYSADGRALFAAKGNGGVPARVYRIDLTNGKATLWRELIAHDAAGLLGIGPILITPDARSYAYSYTRTLSDLYLVGGLR